MTIFEIPIESKIDWQTALSSSVFSFDVYQTLEYNELFIKQAVPTLLFFTKKNYKICFPLLIRNIGNGPYKDVTSVYGYGGLLFNQRNIPINIKIDFLQELTSYFLKKNIISAFSRLHPLIKTSADFPEKMGFIEEINKTVYINLALSDKEQINQYSHSLRRQLKNMYNSKITFRIADKSEYLQFMTLYYKTMDRLNADKTYYFSEDYFKKLVAASGFRTLIIFAEYNDKIIGGDRKSVV